MGIAAFNILAILAVSGVIVAGLYDVAADAPNAVLVRNLIAYTRERSIDVRASSVRVPPLGDAQMIADGASDYNQMCTGCHLAPGMAENEMRPGLNPKPPQLATLPRGDAAEQFWIIKHGIDMTGMPAWGKTHSDAEIWNMVAFLQNLPTLTPTRYRALTAAAAGHHAHDGGMGGMDMGH